jgi:predicted GIY-YIG superfamily endonuclease
MTHANENNVMLRYIYIIEIDNRGKKSGYYGIQRLFYTGQTNDLWRRLSEHITGRNSKFLSTNFRDAQKKLVFVKQIIGKESDAVREEYAIKPLSRQRKEAIINDPVINDMVAYVPFSHIILRSYNDKNCQLVLRPNTPSKVEDLD